MNTATELRSKLKNIDHKGYPAYKELREIGRAHV